MVRTRASNAASRKAVVAKAPRKNIVPGRSSVISPNGGASGKRKGKAGGSGGNPLKLWPVPKGQKGLQGFLGGQSSGESGDGSSSLPMEGTASSSSEQLEDFELVDTTQVEEGSGPSSSSSYEEDVPNHSMNFELVDTQVEEGSGPSSSSSYEEDVPNHSMNLLDDITQLNSDGDED